MLTVYKYDLGNYESKMSIPDKTKLPQFLEVTIQTHQIIKYLSVEVINSHLFIWALAHGDKAQVDKKFAVYPTGYQIKDIDESKLEHVGTYHEKQWNHVWHVFEVKA